MREAGIHGYFTNYSLRATATTRLYDAQIDEASIMERTGHRSLNEVRAYKRSSEKLCELTSSVSNRSEKKTKIEEDEKIEGGENIQPAELSKPNNLMQSLPTMPWNFGGASQLSINFNFAGQ